MINELITKEMALINRMFQQSKVMAKVTASQTILVEVGYVSYGLTLAMSEKFSKVEGLHRELSALVSSHRQRAGLPATQVMPVTSPRLALEVAHPSPKKLLWSPRKVTAGAPHAMAIGRSYGIRPKDEQISFERVPHILIAGMTDAGKTMLLHTMLLSLCAATSPDDLRLVLVDLKNEDLAPFERLPHILTFAGTKAAAVDAIRFVVNEKDRRIEQRGYKPYRLVLVVDEMMQLAGNSEVRDMLGDLASIGRSKLINLIGATQHPTEKGGLGTLLGANFGARLVGRVAPGNSFAATRRPQIHADLLPGRGSFLRIEGPDVVRFQSYFIDTNDVALMAKYISEDLWGGKLAPLAPVQSEAVISLVYTPPAPPVAPVQSGVCTTPAPLFPLAERRPLTATEGAEVRRLSANGMSKNGLMDLIYEGKSPRYKAWVDEALGDDGKVIKLRKTG